MTPAHLAIVLVNLAFLVVVTQYCSREVARRRRLEGVFKHQSDRERLVNQIAQQIRQSLDIEQVLRSTVEEVQRFLAADRVLIYRLWDDGTGSAIYETVTPPYPEVLDQTFPAEVFPSEYHQAYLLGKTRTITSVDQVDVEDCLREFVKQFGVQAKLVVPIIQQDRSVDQLDSQLVRPAEPYLWGLLIVHQCSRPRLWQDWEVELMKQLSTQVAIAIQQSELYKQLQQLNTQLEHRVKQRTAELAKANVSLKAEIVERQRTELALRHTNDTLRALVTASPRAIVMLDRQGKVKIWNPAAEQMFGWTEAEVIDQPNPIGLDDDRSDFPSLQTSVLEGTTYSRLEFRQQKKDGTPIDIIFSAAPLPDSAGQVNGIVAVIADITEQKQQAEQVRLLQSVVVNTNDAVIITEAEPIDEPGPRILYVNEAFTRITGYFPEEVIGKTPRILQGPRTSQVELQQLRAALSDWRSVTVEIINYRKDGTEFWNEFSIVPVANQTGRYTHWIAVQRDTTGRKQAEEALRQSEERFRSLIENALDIILILDLDGTVTYVSPSVERILGYSSADLIDCGVLNHVHPDDLAAAEALFLLPLNHPSVIAQAETEITQLIEFRYHHQDGSWRILEAIAQPFVDSSAIAQILVTARDVTERKRLDEIHAALEREKQLSALKTRFFSMASHEFRTPLSTALAAAQLLENSQTEWDNTEKRLRNLHRIQDSVKNMVQLLDDILTINRAESGNLTLNLKPLDLVSLCRSFVDEIQLTTGRQHSLDFVCALDTLIACLDEKLIRSILANLLSNAIKYSPQGGKVRLALERSHETIFLRFEDQGIGIPQEDHRQLFEPFYRGKNVATIPGTGLGLAVIKKCLDLHHGTLNIYSTLGQGTTCLVSLPLRAIEERGVEG